MFGFKKSKPNTQTQDKPQTKGGLFSRLKQQLSKTRTGLTEGLSQLILGKKNIDDELLEDIEAQLVMADVGIEATQEIIKNLTDRLNRKTLKDAESVLIALKEDMASILKPVSQPFVIPEDKKPFVLLVIGVNGVGKTTTIGKLANRFQQQGKSVMLAAGDTFRAAAVEQLETWGERNNIPVIAQKNGTDPASVIFDAISSAKAKNIDVLIADTAGRLHTQNNLMEELKKIVRVIQKVDPTAPHETMLVLDSGTGQNALSQARQFNEAVDITGLTLTKLDGTAKGGILFALSKNMNIPIRFIGIGESLEDLREFDSTDFVNALFDIEDNPEE
ncbi:MAG: signal recognition particle-docking protein FtsY [Methylococcales bacterium]|jgi:fused signal recognition particle receptor|nr:signal recognition particle-docking protein FtsY [Methylococcales bacterium]MBT7443023.1 signal recognition particle-docking protein FtsY [Methylococcales bacterium]